MGSNIETLTVGSLSLKYLYSKNFYVKNYIYVSVSIVQPVSHLELRFWCF